MNRVVYYREAEKIADKNICDNKIRGTKMTVFASQKGLFGTANIFSPNIFIRKFFVNDGIANIIIANILSGKICDSR
jgi:hypothetical protein